MSFCGAIRPDQRVNAATTDPEIDIANGVEAREFLGQPVGFENELIGQSNFPISHRREALSRFAEFLRPGRFPQTPQEFPSAVGRLRPGICRQQHGLRKVQCWA